MARPPISTEEHRLRGTKSRAAADRPAQFVAGKPKMPKDLPPVAQAEWKRLVKDLARRGTLTRADSSAMEIYCRMFARWRAADEAAQRVGPEIETSWLDKNGVEHTKTVANPTWKLAAQLEANLRHMLQQFSATPASRERTKPAKPDPAKQPVDPDNPMGIVYED